MAKQKSLVARGLKAGFLAATVLVIWFLVIDVVRGRPLYTPAFVASALSGRATVLVGVGIVAAYTVIHYVSFLAIGIALAWALDRIHVLPGFLLGIVVGFLLFDLVFYGSVIVTGVNVVELLGWPSVLAGNVLAGIILMGSLQRSSDKRPVTWIERLAEHRILREGLVAGLLGAIVVAVWFLIFDAFAGRIFFTPAALGSALLYGASSAAEVQITIATVVTYTLLHITAFVGFGIVAAALAVEAERQPPLLLGLILFFVTFEALFVGLIAIFATWILDTLGGWNVAVGNLIAALAIGAYLWAEHPHLQREIRELRDRSLEEPA